MGDAYQVCRVCEKQFPAMQSLGFADNKCADCSGPVEYSPKNVLAAPYITSVELIEGFSRSRLVSHKEPEGRAETPPPGQEDERRLERHPNTAGLPGPTDTVEITEEGLEALSEDLEPLLPPEALEADVPSVSSDPLS